MDDNDTDDFTLRRKKEDFENNKSIKKMWKVIEQRPSDFDMQIIDTLKSTITNKNNKNNIQTYSCYGEHIYLNIRKQLCTFKSNDKIINFLLTTNNTTVEKTVPNTDNISSSSILVKKADIIRNNATISKLNERLIIMLNSLNLNIFTIPSVNIMNSQILEIRAIGFIYIAWFIATHKDKYIDKLIPFSAIVSLQRFINIITTSNSNNVIKLYYGSNNMNPSESMYISKTLVNDLQHLEQILTKAYSFNGLSLYEQASELILGSQFDIYLPHKIHEAFDHQKKVSQALLDIENLKDGFIMFYRTMTNSGKTSTIINIATAVQELRMQYPTIFGDLQVIATCDVQPVLTKWGQLLYHAGIPFGIAAKRFYPSNPEYAQRVKNKALKDMLNDRDCVDIDVKFSNSDTCKSIKDRIAIICSPEIALKILKADNTKHRFILLHDEPTMYAECLESKELNTNIQIIKYAPKWSIFSSATLPFDEKSKIFINYHKTKFVNAKFIDNCSTEIYSCCNIRTFDNKSITPHLGCTTQLELINAIKHIEQNPFLGKLYTPSSIKLLWEESIEAGSKNTTFIKQLPNILEIFSKVENLYPDNIRKIALEILKTITLLNDNQITYICSMDYEPDDDIINDVIDDVVGVGVYDSIVFNKLGTSEAHKFQYLNLIATDKPIEFINTNYINLLTDIKHKIGSLDKLKFNYQQKLDSWQHDFDALEKRFKNDNKLIDAQNEMYEYKPNIIFPEECQLNTKQHLFKYAKHIHNNTNNSFKYRTPININNIDIDDLHITDDNKLHLLSGICCYTSPNKCEIDPNYLDIILELTSYKKIETLIADSSICYGTDYPIGGIIITDEFSNNHSLNTIYQLMSRAGRGRKSNSAEIYISNTCATRILNTVKQGITTDTNEVDNMITVFTSLTNI